jgi:SAM-dependent methyltransferase
MSPLAGVRVLEVGCGNGVLLPKLAEAVGRTGRVVGIDHSETFVSEAQARIDRAGLGTMVTVQRGDAYRLPFERASFDRAHCERVLMHLDDPNAALAEMRRVVRPGGWVVAAEPDWPGIRVDHVDRIGMDLFWARESQNRQPDVGLTLFRRFAEVGLVELRAAPVMGVITDLAVLKGYGLNLPRVADAVVADGLLAREQADALVRSLEDANASGRFYSAGLIHVVGGRVPN